MENHEKTGEAVGEKRKAEEDATSIQREEINQKKLKIDGI